VTRQQPRPGEQAASAGQVAAHAALVAARARLATPGPWGYDRAGAAVVAADGTGLREVAGCGHDPDAAFIAHARADVPWLLGQLAAEQAARAALERRLDALRVAVGRANEALDRLPWQGDGLAHLAAEHKASAEVVAAVHAAASALDREALGLKVDHAGEGVRS
jgi:hypothetical protein